MEPQRGLSALRTDLCRSMGDYRRLNEQLVQWSGILLEQTSGHGQGTVSGGEPCTVAVNNSCQHYIQYLLSLEEVVGSTETLVRTSQHSLKLDRGRVHVDNVSRAVESVSRCLQYTIALVQLEDAVRGAGASIENEIGTQKVVELLRTLSHAVVQRVADAAKGCRGVLAATMQQYLLDCSWPPPLLPSASNSKPARPTPDQTPSSSSGWTGFEDAGDTVFGELQEIIVQMLVLQGAMEHDKFSKLGEDTARDVELWPAIEFADAVNAWISLHFAPNLPTCRIERPEWLFSAVYHATSSCIEHLDVFESCIEAQGIQQYFSMPVEVAKSVYHRGLRAVVKGVYVPLLFEERDASYVLHFADEAVKFEDTFLPLRTDPLMHVANRPSTGAAGQREGCILLDLLFAEESWKSHWLQFEEEEARQRVWNDVSGDADGLETGPSPSAPLLQYSLEKEFRQSEGVQHVLDTLVHLLNRITYMSVADHQLEWCRTVVSTAIDTLKDHLRSEISRIEQFDHLTDNIGAPTVSACLNDLRFLEHVLLEPSGALLNVFYSSGPRLLTPFFEQHAVALSTLRRKWMNVVIEAGMEVVSSAFLVSFDEGVAQISRVLEIFSEYLDQVAFRELWKGVAASVNHAWLESLPGGPGAPSEGATDPGARRERLEQLIGVFAPHTKNPAAYFKESLAHDNSNECN